MSSHDPNIERMEAQIQDWGARIESLEARAQTAGTHARVDYRRRVQELKALGSDARARLEEFKSAGSETWDAFRTGVEGAWKDIEAALEELVREEARPVPPPRTTAQRTSRPGSTGRGQIPQHPARHRNANR
jgi:hypothetical protein